MFCVRFFVLFEPYVRFHFSFKFEYLSGRLLGKKTAHSAYDMFSQYKYPIVGSVFFPLRFLKWEFLSGCAFFLIYLCRIIFF